jgi:predicted dehydrogenase
MNLGVLGSGFIVTNFLPIWKQYGFYHLKAIWGRHEEKIKQFENDFDYYTTDLKKVFNDESIDVIYIGLPNSLHYSYAKKALLAGKHVIVEKPFCVTYKEAEELINLGKEKKLFVFEAIVTQFAKNYLDFKPHIEKIGPIKIVDGNFSQYSRRYDRFKEGTVLPAFNKDLAGGALMDLGVYNIHYTVGLFGRPVGVYYYPNMYQGVDTSGVLVLDYGEFKASLINSKDSKAPCYINIQGEKGCMRCASTASRVAEIEMMLNDGESKMFSDGIDGEFGASCHEWIEFERMYREKDFASCHKYNEITLHVQYVLEQAAKSANLPFLLSRELE